MNIYERRDARGGRRATMRLLPEQAAAAYRLGAAWREEWRAIKAEEAKKATEVKTTLKQVSPSRQGPTHDEASRRAKFAEEIARSELGRDYWDKRRQGNLRDQPKRMRDAKRKT
jgi:hypothetical protein